MDYNTVIEYGFKLFVENKFQNDDIRRFLINHERLPILINNLSRELKGAEHVIHGSPEQRKEIVKNLISDFSLTFCKTALNEIANRRGLSNDSDKS